MVDLVDIETDTDCVSDARQIIVQNFWEATKQLLTFWLFL